MNQIATYVQRVKRMVGRVLTVNGVTSYADDHYRLLGGVAEGFCEAVELSDAERDELLQLKPFRPGCRGWLGGARG